MVKEVELFKFVNEDVRIVEIEGEPWFVAKDVCNILEIKNPRDTIRKVLDDDERMLSVIHTPSNGGVDNSYPSNGGESEVNLISESGLYALIFRSKKPGARAFTRWLTHIVLPQIRKTGKYAVKEEEKVRSLRMIKKIHSSNLEMDINIYVHDGMTAARTMQIENGVSEFIVNIIDLTA